jgi:hypothetical protein
LRNKRRGDSEGRESVGCQLLRSPAAEVGRMKRDQGRARKSAALSGTRPDSAPLPLSSTRPKPANQGPVWPCHKANSEPSGPLAASTHSLTSAMEVSLPTFPPTLYCLTPLPACFRFSSLLPTNSPPFLFCYHFL